MDTTESAGGAAGHLEAIAQRLHRPAASLPACTVLSPEQQAILLAALDRAFEQRAQDLDRSLARLIPWPLRAPLLRWLRR